jgi:hypothetical protein
MMKLRTERKHDALLDGEFRYCGVAAIGLAGAAIGAIGANSAADTQADAADRSSAISDRQYQQTRTDQLAQYAQQRADSQQYRDEGYKALTQLGQGLAPGGEFNRNFTMADFVRDPGYGFRQEQGEQGINRAATAAGSRYSGATLKELTRFNSGLAAQEFGSAYDRYKSDLGDRFNRLSGVAGTGQTAVSQTGQAGQNAFSNIAQAGQNNSNAQGNALRNAGAARASGYVGMANAVNSGLGTWANNQQQQQFLNQMNTPPPDYSYMENGGYGGAGGLY